jgi:hypothetical protein
LPNIDNGTENTCDTVFVANVLLYERFFKCEICAVYDRLQCITLRVDLSLAQVKNKMLRLTMVQDKIAIINKEAEAVYKYNQLLDELQCIDNVQPIAIMVKENIKRYETLCRWLSVAQSEQKNIEAFNQQLAQLKGVDDLDVKSITDKINKYVAINNAMAALNTSMYKMKAADEFIQASHVVDHFGDDKYAIQAKIEKLLRLQQLLNVHEQLLAECDANEKQFKTATEQYDIAVQDKVDFLREHHTCPWCYSEINDETIEVIIEKSK